MEITWESDAHEIECALLCVAMAFRAAKTSIKCE